MLCDVLVHLVKTIKRSGSTVKRIFVGKGNGGRFLRDFLGMFGKESFQLVDFVGRKSGVLGNSF